MAEIFVHSGSQIAGVGVPGPALQGIFVNEIDKPNSEDGFGLVVPFGGGATARRYKDYGVSAEVSTQRTQLNSLSIKSNLGDGVSYNFEGLVGPQGIPGRDGLPGITTVIGLPAYNSNFLTALPDTIDQINDLGTAVDKLIYTSAFITTVNFIWSKISVESATNSWNESDINDDATFYILVADNGIHVSTDGGSTWNSYDPRSEAYNQVQCADSGGKAAVMGNDSRKEGIVLVTSDYGVNWTEKIISV